MTITTNTGHTPGRRSVDDLVAQIVLKTDAVDQSRRRVGIRVEMGCAPGRTASPRG